MKILLIVSSYAPNTGGLQTVTAQLAKELLARGQEVSVLTNRYPRTLAEHELVDGVQVTRWQFLAPQLRYLLGMRFDLFVAGILYFPLTLKRLVSQLRRERPDIVNLHFVGAPAFFVLLARSLKQFRLVVSVHGDDVEGLSTRGWFDHWVFRSLMRRADAVTACSRFLLDAANEFESSIAKKGRVIHNGMAPLRESNRSEGSRGMLAVGRMFPSKGFDVLLQAYAETERNAQLTLIGDGPEREVLGRLARSLGLNGEVRFRGQQDRGQVLAEMAAADLVVIPSRHETFGLVALEAMALGKPIVASRVGGLPEVLQGADALLVEPGDPAQLAEAIEYAQARLRSEPQFGIRNRQLAAGFSMERMTDGYLEAYVA
jgi:glycosyltransferase involved in cell wall biosynthesis